MATGLHLNLDRAWPAGALPVETLDAARWGPLLRFTAPARLMEDFNREIGGRLPPFVLYGSGDFHHLTALWVRQMAEPFVLVSFDHHPDWDLRPPRWCCGGWVNRVLEHPHLKKVSVWGCGSGGRWWPGGLFGNRRAEREGRLEIHRWTESGPLAGRSLRGTIRRPHWREHFSAFVRALGESNLYVTIDLDCLRAEDAVTNWENGHFTLDDLAWALAQLRGSDATIVRGDICGAFSPPVYARPQQRFIAEMDHPKLPPRDVPATTTINLRAFHALWPLLAG